MESKLKLEIFIYTATALAAVVFTLWLTNKSIHLATDFPSELNAIANQIESGELSPTKEKMVSYLKAAAAREVEVTIINNLRNWALALLAAGYATIICILVRNSHLTRRLMSQPSVAVTPQSGAEQGVNRLGVP